jgi:hypothetical protein
MKLNINKEFELLSLQESRYILVFGKYNLLISNEFLEFMVTYPNLTFKGNVSIKVGENYYMMYSFIHWLALIELFTDEGYLEHIHYHNLLNEIKIIPFCTSLSQGITYFIGAEKDNLNLIYHYDINSKMLTVIANSIEELFNEKIIYNLSND